MVSPLFESVPPQRYGGTERVVYNLCRGLKERGVEVTLFASGDSTVNVNVVPVIDSSLRLRAVPVPDPNAYHFKMLNMIARRAGEFDLIHNHHDYWMLPLAKMTHTPLLTTLHGRLDVPELVLPIPDCIEGRFIAISESQRTSLPHLCWAKTIHHGIDPTEFKFQPSPGSYLAFLGRITREKRPEWAIEVAKRSGVPLKIAAKIEGREMQDYYDAYVAPHVDGKFIEYVGEISEREKSDFLGGALAMVFPIDWPEPFGLVLLESLACGTPVLARPCGAVPEILEDGVTGFSHPGLSELARRVGQIARIDRAACRRWVEERFSLDRMTEDYLDAYGTLSGAGHPRARARASASATAQADDDARRGTDRHRRHLLHTV